MRTKHLAVLWWLKEICSDWFLRDPDLKLHRKAMGQQVKKQSFGIKSLHSKNTEALGASEDACQSWQLKIKKSHTFPRTATSHSSRISLHIDLHPFPSFSFLILATSCHERIHRPTGEASRSPHPRAPNSEEGEKPSLAKIKGTWSYRKENVFWKGLRFTWKTRACLSIHVMICMSIILLFGTLLKDNCINFVLNSKGKWLGLSEPQFPHL